MRAPVRLLQKFGVKSSVCQARRAGRPAARGSRWEEISVAAGRKRMQRGLLSLQSVLCSAGERGYVSAIIVRGRPGLAVCQPLTFSALSHNPSQVAKWSESSRWCSADLRQHSLYSIFFIVLWWRATLTRLLSEQMSYFGCDVEKRCL